MSPSSYCWEQHPCKWFPSFPEKRERCAETRRSRAHMSSTHDEEAPQKLLRVVVYTTLSRALGVQGIYRASISNICSAVAGTAYVVCAEPFILWLPRLQMNSKACITPPKDLIPEEFFDYLYTCKCTFS